WQPTQIRTDFTNLYKSYMPVKISRLKYYLSQFLIVSLMLAGGCIEEQFIEPEVYGSVSGKVLSETTKEPIAGAIVRVSPSSRVVETNAEGFFRVDSLVTGNYTLMTTFDKYRSDLTTVTIEHNRNFDVSIYLTLDTRLNAPPAVPIVVKPAQDENDVEVSDVILAWKSTDADKDTLS